MNRFISSDIADGIPAIFAILSCSVYSCHFYFTFTSLLRQSYPIKLHEISDDFSSFGTTINSNKIVDAITNHGNPVFQTSEIHLKPYLCRESVCNLADKFLKLH